MSLKKESFGSEIKRLARERRRRREANEILIAKEYVEKDKTECGYPCVGAVNDIGRGKPEEAVRRLRKYAELRNRILLKLEEALIEAREVIRREVKPKPMNVKQLKLILGKICASNDYNPKRSHLLKRYREEVAEPPPQVFEIEVMTSKEIKRELSRLGLNFKTNMRKSVLKNILIEDARKNKNFKAKQIEWGYPISRRWFAMSRWYFTRRLTMESFTIWAFVKGEGSGTRCIYYSGVREETATGL
ncbi:Hypothetical predicted protein [Paramuricea clavata]|uniref:Uncharacterized protein n=1 Tax=Paramuricea clavata TaxID=317549 RepID=A0A7D9I7C1_PARCT|nr:Hypothetical predicted protein [Paramuricea clavata]